MDIKRLLVEKERVFKANYRCGGKLIQREIQEKINHNKGIYKLKVEQLLLDNNSQMACRGIKTMFEQNNQQKVPAHTVEEANTLNEHFSRWESGGRAETSCLDNAIEGVPISLSCSEVGQVFSLVKPLKAAGPDKLQSMVLRTCHEQLRFVFQ